MGAVADKLRIEITVDDKGSPVIQYFKGNVKAGLEDVTRATAGSTSGFASLWKGMFAGQAAFAVVNAGFRGIKEGLVGTFAESMAFERGFANVTTLLANGSEVTGELKQGMLDMAGSLGSATELTEGLYNALSAGVAPGEAVQFIGESAKFSRAALAGMYQSVDVLTTVLNAYGMKASEVTDVSDVLFQVIKDGKVTGQELASSLGSVIPTAAAMGVNIREVGAAIAIMTQGGIGAGEAVTALNQTLLSALSPTKDAEKMAKSLGIELSKAGIEGAGGLQKWLQQLKEKIGDNTEAMSVLFPNVRALKSALSLAGEQSAKYAQEMEILKNVTGVTDEAFKKQEATMTAITTAIKNELSAAIIQLLLPALKTVREWLEKNKESIIEYGKKIMAFAGDVARLIGGVIGWFIKNRDAIIAMGAAMTTVFVINKIQTWYKALDIAGSSLMTVIQRAQMLRAVGAGPIDAFTQSINYSFGAATTLAGALKNLPAVGMAAFAGWKIGQLIGELTGLNGVMQNVYAELLDIYGLQAKEKGQAAAISTQRAVSTAQIRDMGKQLGITSASLGVNAQAIFANKDAMEKLSPNAQAIVTRLGEHAAASAKAAGKTDALTDSVRDNSTGLGNNISQLTEAEKKVRAKALADWDAARAAEQWNKDLGSSSQTMDALNVNSFGLAASFKLGAEAIADSTFQLNQNEESLFNLSDAQYYEVKATKEQEDQNKETVTSFEELQAIVDIASTSLSAIGDVFDQLGIDASGIIDPLQKGFGGVTQLAGGLAKMKTGADGVKPSFMDMAGGIGSVIGGVGSLISAGVGLCKFLNSLLPDSLDNAVRAQNAWMDLNEKMIEQIKETAKAIAMESAAYAELESKIGGMAAMFAADIASSYDNVHAATSKNLAGIIAQTDMTVDNFEEFAARTREILSDYDRGILDLAQTQSFLGDSFSALIAKAKELGVEGSAGLITMYEDLTSRGIEVAEIQGYINAKLESAADAYADLKDKIDGSTIAQQVFGNISVPILDEILAYREKVAKNQDLVDSIGAATKMMVDFTDVTRINQGQFDQFQISASKSFDALKAGGMNGSQALQAMGPYLQRLQFLHEQYGFTIDANTQKILDQAIKEGKVQVNKKTETQQMIDLLSAIAVKLGADIPGALDKTAKAATEAFKNASKAAGQFDSALDGIGGSRNFNVNTKAKGDYIAAAAGGQWYVPGGSFTKFVTGEDEDEIVTVTPRSKFGSRGGVPSPSLDVQPRSPIVFEDHSVLSIQVSPRSGIDQGELTEALITVVKDNRALVADKLAYEIARKM